MDASDHQEESRGATERRELSQALGLAYVAVTWRLFLFIFSTIRFS